MNSDGKLSENFEERVRQCLLNVRAILQGGGMDFANLVSVHVYLTDLGTFELMNKIYWQMMGDNPPARTVLGVAALPGGNTIEINAIAVADARTKRAVWPSGWTRSATSRSTCSPGRRTSLPFRCGRKERKPIRFHIQNR